MWKSYFNMRGEEQGWPDSCNFNLNRQLRKIKDLTGWMMKNNRAARAARFLVQFFDVVCQTTTWNFHIWGYYDNASL